MAEMRAHPTSIRIPEDSVAAQYLKSFSGNRSKLFREALEFYLMWKDSLPEMSGALVRLADKYDELEAGVVPPGERQGAVAAADLSDEVMNNLASRRRGGKQY